ncbi:SIS domain-containing protein [Paenibacillus terreus]|uniref:SIS domain-containing protein n=1 Tax=Paenibacillus terreus TaxID=1387834 RepID=A0ABV5BCX1_9BACL
MTTTTELIDYVYAQPAMLKEIVNNRKELLKSFMDGFLKNNVSRIIFTGSGSSYNAAMSSRHFIEKTLQVEVQVEFAHTFAQYSCVYDKQTLVFALSQSGESTAAVECVQKANELGLFTVAVTSQEGSLITEFAQNQIIVPSGEEKAGATTKGFTATTLTLYLMAIETAYAANKLEESEYNRYIQTLLSIIDNMKNTIAAAEAWYNEHKDELLEAKSYVFSGTGDLYGTAMEAGLKFLETSRIPVSIYEFEEFMHGPYNAIDENSYIFYFADPGQDYERMLTLADYFAKITPHGFVVTKSSDQPRPGSLSPEFINDPDLAPIEYIVPMQVLFFRAAKERGVNMRTPRYVDFHPSMKSKRRLRFL